MAAVAVVGAAALGALAIDARGEVPPQPPIPPLPPPPVQVPTLPQLPRVPQPRPPKVPSLPRVPAVPAPSATPAPPGVTGPIGQGGRGSSSSGSSGGSGGSSYSSSGGAAQAGATGSTRPANPPVRVVRIAPQRHWITRSGRRALRKTTLGVVLSAPGIVVFDIVRVAPDCAAVGRFRIKGRAGLNRVPFRGRVRGRALVSGTYRIRAYVRGRAVAQTRIVIFDRRPLPGEVAAARSANACGSERAGAATSAATGSGVETGAAAAGKGRPRVLRIEQRNDQAGAGSDERAGGGGPSAGVLGARFERATDAVREVHPLLFLLLGFAIALLTLAALPLRYVPNARIAALLAYRRSAVAVAGAMVLASVMVLYALA